MDLKRQICLDEKPGYVPSLWRKVPREDILNIIEQYQTEEDQDVLSFIAEYRLDLNLK